MSNICGYIYIFFNPAMCGLVKIGFASDVEQLRGFVERYMGLV